MAAGQDARMLDARFGCLLTAEKQKNGLVQIDRISGNVDLRRHGGWQLTLWASSRLSFIRACPVRQAQGKL